MFYRLSNVDGAQLPCHVSIDRRPYTVTHGGLLLEPPSGRTDYNLTDGLSLLQLFGMLTTTEVPAFLASSSEPYRWTSHDQLSISRRESGLGVQFHGIVRDTGLKLRAVGENRLLTLHTVLQFVMAPDDPISDEWSAAFDYGPPQIRPSETDGDDATLLAAIQEHVLAGEPERHRAARARLESAWGASA
jgi:hypothetical protein